MVVPTNSLPDDPGTLKAMLLAERTRAERLEQIVRELQRHRFGRRAETLPEDQLLLGFEEVEQTAAGEETDHEAKSPAEREARASKRRANRGSCQATCRASRWSTFRISAARAAVACCMSSAKIGPSGSTSSPPSSGFWWFADPNTLVGLARTWWCRRPHQRG